MPILLYNLELTEDEIIQLFALLAMRELRMGLSDNSEQSILVKVEELLEVSN
jgi:hypothetical protein